MLRYTFPPERHEEVARFFGEEMLAVIRDNEGFVDFRVLDAGTPGELITIDTWHSREDSVTAIQRPAAQAVHGRYQELEIAVAAVSRYTVVAAS